MHKLIRYLLTPSVSERPDIYQASQLAFSLKTKKSPIQNLHQLSAPQWAELGVSLGPVKSSSSPAASHSPAQAQTTPGKLAQQPPMETVTSVNPRSRPKGEYLRDYCQAQGPLSRPLLVNFRTSLDKFMKRQERTLR